MTGLEYKHYGTTNPAVDPSSRTLYIGDLPLYFDEILLSNTLSGKFIRQNCPQCHFLVAVSVRCLFATYEAMQKVSSNPQSWL